MPHPTKTQNQPGKGSSQEQALLRMRLEGTSFAYKRVLKSLALLAGAAVLIGAMMGNHARLLDAVMAMLDTSIKFWHNATYGWYGLPVATFGAALIAVLQMCERAAWYRAVVDTELGRDAVHLYKQFRDQSHHPVLGMKALLVVSVPNLLVLSTTHLSAQTLIPLALVALTPAIVFTNFYQFFLPLNSRVSLGSDAYGTPLKMHENVKALIVQFETSEREAAISEELRKQMQKESQA